MKEARESAAPEVGYGLGAAVARAEPGRLQLRLRVQPRASRNRVAGLYGDALKLQIAAPAVEGAANAALIEYLAGALGLRRDQLRLLSGERGRSKLLELRVDDPGAILRRLREIAGL